MDMKEIATALVEGCNTGKEEENLGRLYAEDAVSVEAWAPPGQSRETAGLDGIRGKHAWWAENFEVHSSSAKGPYPHGDDKFGVVFAMDVTEKASGNRNQMDELAVYHVKDGKITREEFFYTSG